MCPHRTLTTHPAFSPGTLLETSRLDTTRWSWQLDYDIRFVLSHRLHNQPLVYTDWQAWLDLLSKTLRFTTGYGLSYVRQYLNGGPDYEEQYESASVIVGAGAPRYAVLHTPAPPTGRRGAASASTLS